MINRDMMNEIMRCGDILMVCEKGSYTNRIISYDNKICLITMERGLFIHYTEDKEEMKKIVIGNEIKYIK
jgi:hypothetical protein